MTKLPKSLTSMLRHAAELTTPLFLAMPLMLLTGCVSVNQAAICDGTKASRSELADALVVAGASDRVILRGAVLIAQIDAACGDAP